ncbi:hydrolase, alpha/beta domain protein [Aeromicrobium marinum DSM 15272]|uniref:Hydrolase, alpha/beta domain protein n=1 Tax=Aeromicrobium marinum DSM 15272 TaxID=585531 RepID=E2SE33_9ACTN|nr:alpha/beta fold hydrolase [Aeromicrobium marinum]EFQ82760.1 hydrolase, alpha/beta domain protein [Aeromicrobium marinum DSM 15272]
MTRRQDVSFTSHGVTCRAWHFTATSDALSTADGRPCVVMAHGFGGTRDTGLAGYAEGFARAGLDVLLFDYRGFGDSDGAPRQHISFRRQRADYRAAVAAARGIDGVDADRIVLWGTSYSGGHVLAVAAKDHRIAAVVSMTPAVDGSAALLAMVRHRGPRSLAVLVGHGLIDVGRLLTRRSPHHLAVVGEPASVAVITAPGALTGYLAVAGPTWRNEVCARTTLEVAFNRPARFAARVRSPLLVQIGEHDTVAPPRAAARAAAAGTYARTHTYPIDHFDVYDGPWQQQALSDQVAFLLQSPGVTPHARQKVMNP